MKPKYLQGQSELQKRWENNKQIKPSGPSITYHTIYQQARDSNHWIFDPQIKRWQTPEEFLELEKRITGGDPKRYDRLQIKDPIEGINAAYEQLQSLKDRMELFVNKVILYYKSTDSTIISDNFFEIQILN